MAFKTIHEVLDALSNSYLTELTKKDIRNYINEKHEKNKVYSHKSISGAIDRSLDAEYIQMVGLRNSICSTCDRKIGPPQHLYDITKRGQDFLKELRQ